MIGCLSAVGAGVLGDSLGSLAMGIASVNSLVALKRADWLFECSCSLLGAGVLGDSLGSLAMGIASPAQSSHPPQHSSLLTIQIIPITAHILRNMSHLCHLSATLGSC